MGLRLDPSRARVVEPGSRPGGRGGRRGRLGSPGVLDRRRGGLSRVPRGVDRAHDRDAPGERSSHGSFRREHALTQPLHPEARRILDEGSFCYLAARTRGGPHLTPLVYSVWASRLWVTTARRSVKARTWKRDPAAGGLVVGGGGALVFRGSARTRDLLDPTTWLSSAVAAPTISLAAVSFARRNARFFAGYAVDAPRIPLAWSPPGRVFTEVRLEAAAVLGDGPEHRWGELGGPVRSRTSFHQSRSRRRPLAGVPADVAE